MDTTGHQQHEYDRYILCSKDKDETNHAMGVTGSIVIRNLLGVSDSGPATVSVTVCVTTCTLLPECRTV